MFLDKYELQKTVPISNEMLAITNKVSAKKISQSKFQLDNEYLMLHELRFQLH